MTRQNLRPSGKWSSGQIAGFELQKTWLASPHFIRDPPHLHRELPEMENSRFKAYALFFAFFNIDISIETSDLSSISYRCTIFDISYQPWSAARQGRRFQRQNRFGRRIFPLETVYWGAETSAGICGYLLISAVRRNLDLRFSFYFFNFMFFFKAVIYGF